MKYSNKTVNYSNKLGNELFKKQKNTCELCQNKTVNHSQKNPSELFNKKADYSIKQ